MSERAEDKAASELREQKREADRAEDQELAAAERRAESNRAVRAEETNNALIARLLSSNDGLTLLSLELKESREARQREAGQARKGARTRNAVGDSED